MDQLQSIKIETQFHTMSKVDRTLGAATYTAVCVGKVQLGEKLRMIMKFNIRLYSKCD